MDCDGFVVTNGLAVSPFNGFMLQKKIFDLFNGFAVNTRTFNEFNSFAVNTTTTTSLTTNTITNTTSITIYYTPRLLAWTRVLRN